MLINGWEVVIGLEVHAQVSSNSKLFSGAATKFGAEPNTQVSLIDAAMPGMLPVLNKFCIEQAVKTGFAIYAQINKTSVFDRKNYFYADLPQGYQISQFYHPIVQNGTLTIKLEDGREKTIRINRIHLEQDAGKSIHDQNPTKSHIDLNRSGVALMEIVSEPDISSAEEAAEYIKKLRMLLRYLDTCDGDMEKGSLRCDANISIRKPGAPLGTRCEIKNLNSIKNIMKAIEYEVARQIDLIESGKEVNQETRLYDADKDETRVMRTKEDAHDYRYFPDPDLLPVTLDEAYLDKIKSEMPELPDDKKERYMRDLGLSDYDAEVLCFDKDVAAFYEEAYPGNDPKITANWIIGELFAYLNKNDLEITNSKITPVMLSEMLKLIQDGTISGKIAKEVFLEMISSGQSAKTIVNSKGLTQINDSAAIETIIVDILSKHADKVAEYKSGKDKMFGFFVGQIMKETGGKANPQMVNEILVEKLK